MTAPPRTYPGERLGLPLSGSGSVADIGPRIVAFLVDCLASGLAAAAVVAIFSSHERSDFTSRLPGNWSLVAFAVDYVGGLLVAGRTVGMYLTGIRVIRVDRKEAVRPLGAIVRTVLLMLLIPALIWDRDRRGLHDRIAQTVVIRN
jgi:uncharacterized RDD family membrane protein YckC